MLSVELQTLYFKHFGYIGESLNFWFSLVSIQRSYSPIGIWMLLDRLSHIIPDQVPQTKWGKNPIEEHRKQLQPLYNPLESENLTEVLTLSLFAENSQSSRVSDFL